MEGPLSIDGLSQFVNSPALWRKAPIIRLSLRPGIADKNFPEEIPLMSERGISSILSFLKPTTPPGPVHRILRCKSDRCRRRLASRCLDRHTMFQFSGIADGLRLSDLLDLVFKHGICALRCPGCQPPLRTSRMLFSCVDALASMISSGISMIQASSSSDIGMILICSESPAALW